MDQLLRHVPNYSIADLLERFRFRPKKSIPFLTLFFTFLFLSLTLARADTENRPKVVVITSSQGGGHNAAAEAVEKSLGSDYEVVKLDLLKDKLGHLDGKFMEYFAQEKWTLVRLMASLQGVMDFYINNHLYGFIKKTMIQEKPDLMVSVFPLGNNAYHGVAKELGIRHLIIPTDLNLDMNLRLFKRKNIEREEMKKRPIVCLNYLRETDLKTLEKRGLLATSRLTGYPVRPQFNSISKKYRSGDISLLGELEALRNKKGIGPDDKVVLIAPMAPIGYQGVGEAAVMDYVNFAAEGIEELLPPGAGERKLHFVVVTGKNEQLYEKIKTRAQALAASSSPVVIHPEKLLPPEDYARSMAMADVPIIKPGGATLNEMISMGKRVLIKSDSAQGIFWEKANLDFMVDQGWALPLNPTKGGRVDKADYLKKLKELLERSDDPPYDSPINEFDVKFKALVDEILK